MSSDDGLLSEEQRLLQVSQFTTIGLRCKAQEILGGSNKCIFSPTSASGGHTEPSAAQTTGINLTSTGCAYRARVIFIG